MTEYIFTKTYRNYYKVEATTAEQAKDILEQCDDLADFQDDKLIGMESIDPEFEFYGIPNR